MKNMRRGINARGEYSRQQDLNTLCGLTSKRGTMELKNNDIYAFPDGTEFVARVGPKGVYFLHALRLGMPSAPIYVVDGSGQFLSGGRRTRWHVRDLHATGRTSRPEIQRLAATDERSILT